MAKFNTGDFARALLGRRAIRRYPFPGTDTLECGIRLLTDSEMDVVRLDAQEYCKRRKIDLQMDPEFLDRAIQRYVVLKAYVDPESDQDLPQPFFDGIEDVQRLDSALVAELFALYAAHQQSMDPLKYADEEEVRSLIEALGKSGSTEHLMILDRRTLLTCVLSMASVLRQTQAPSK